MGLRKRLAEWLFKDEYTQLRGVARDMVSDWRMVPYTLQRQGALWLWAL